MKIFPIKGFFKSFCSKHDKNLNEHGKGWSANLSYNRFFLILVVSMVKTCLKIFSSLNKFYFNLIVNRTLVVKGACLKISSLPSFYSYSRQKKALSKTSCFTNRLFNPDIKWGNGPVCKSFLQQV